VVRSDNLSAMTIVKDQLTIDASSKKIAIDIKAELNEDSIPHMLSLLNPMIAKQLEVAKKWALIDAIKELVTGEEDTSFLSQEYKDILRDEATIKQRYHEQPGILSYMWTVIADLYGDAAKIKGRSNISDSLK